ncbi:hypothetical protein, partial [Glutamicibacter sp.]
AVKPIPMVFRDFGQYSLLRAKGIAIPGNPRDKEDFPQLPWRLLELLNRREEKAERSPKELSIRSESAR